MEALWSWCTSSESKIIISIQPTVAANYNPTLQRREWDYNYKMTELSESIPAENYANYDRFRAEATRRLNNLRAIYKRPNSNYQILPQSLSEALPGWGFKVQQCCQGMNTTLSEFELRYEPAPSPIFIDGNEE